MVKLIVGLNELNILRDGLEDTIYRLRYDKKLENERKKYKKSVEKLKAKIEEELGANNG